MTVYVDGVEDTNKSKDVVPAYGRNSPPLSSLRGTDTMNVVDILNATQIYLEYPYKLLNRFVNTQKRTHSSTAPKPLRQSRQLSI